MVDAQIKVSDTEPLKGWMQGQIVDIIGDNNMHVMFVNAPSKYDCVFNRWSTSLAEFESKTAET